jgi:hypothetical protein
MNIKSKFRRMAAKNDQVVWYICQYQNKSKHEEEWNCQHCPATIEIKHYGTGVNGCRALAEEMLAVTLQAFSLWGLENAD